LTIICKQSARSKDTPSTVGANRPAGTSIIVIVLARHLPRFSDPSQERLTQRWVSAVHFVSPTQSVRFAMAVAGLAIDHHVFFAICPDVSVDE